MLLVALQSSNLRAASYDEWSATLTIEFHLRAAYEYLDVPPQVYDGLVAAESPGRFHHARIKDQFRYRRLS